MSEVSEALARLERTLATQQTSRAQAWARIQAEAPDLAALLSALRVAFGRPRSVSVRLNGERVL